MIQLSQELKVSNGRRLNKKNHSVFCFADGPENIILTTNATTKVCTRDVIHFTCTASQANPPVHTYLLYQNDTVINSMGISGTWVNTMENAGTFVFRCVANNSVQGIGKSGFTTMTVDGEFEVIFNYKVSCVLRAKHYLKYMYPMTLKV